MKILKNLEEQVKQAYFNSNTRHRRFKTNAEIMLQNIITSSGDLATFHAAIELTSKKHEREYFMQVSEKHLKTVLIHTLVFLYYLDEFYWQEFKQRVGYLDEQETPLRFYTELKWCIVLNKELGTISQVYLSIDEAVKCNGPLKHKNITNLREVVIKYALSLIECSIAFKKQNV